MTIDGNIIHYAEKMSTPASATLMLIERFVALKTSNPGACSSPLQGRLLSMLSKIMLPKRILEVGTFAAYGTICLAEGLDEHGTLITIEVNEELEEIISRHIAQSSGKGRIEVVFGNALDIIPTLEGPFDLAFVDAAKQEYIEYYEILVPKMRQGGLVIADNVLWKGKVLDPEDDAFAKSLNEFNKHVLRDARTENVLLPFRDGLNLILKL